MHELIQRRGRLIEWTVFVIFGGGTQLVTSFRDTDAREISLNGTKSKIFYRMCRVTT